jgi:hypothetical protein
MDWQSYFRFTFIPSVETCCPFQVLHNVHSKCCTTNLSFIPTTTIIVTKLMCVCSETIIGYDGYQKIRESVAETRHGYDWGGSLLCTTPKTAIECEIWCQWINVTMIQLVVQLEWTNTAENFGLILMLFSSNFWRCNFVGICGWLKQEYEISHLKLPKIGL